LVINIEVLGASSRAGWGGGGGGVNIHMDTSSVLEPLTTCKFQSSGGRVGPGSDAWEVLCSILGQNTEYPNGFRGLFVSLQENAGVIL
jgi:hypothetical protein